MLEQLIRQAREELQEQLDNGQLVRSVVNSIRRQLTTKAARELMYDISECTQAEYEMTNGRPRRVR